MYSDRWYDRLGPLSIFDMVVYAVECNGEESMYFDRW